MEDLHNQWCRSHEALVRSPRKELAPDSLRARAFVPGAFIRFNRSNAVEMRSQTRPASHHQTWKVAGQRARGNQRQRCPMQPVGEPCLQARGRLDAAAAPRGAERRRQRRLGGCQGVLLFAPAPCHEAALLPWVARAQTQGSRSLQEETACICTAMGRQAGGAPWRAACRCGSCARRLRAALGSGWSGTRAINAA